MKTIKYFMNGKEVELEVDDAFAEKYAEISAESKREAERNRWRVREKLVSLDAVEEDCVWLWDKDEDVEEKAIQNDRKERVRKAIAMLTPEQRELIIRVYYKEESITAIAKEMNIDKTSIRDRLRAIYKKIQKILQN